MAHKENVLYCSLHENFRVDPFIDINEVNPMKFQELYEEEVNEAYERACAKFDHDSDEFDDEYGLQLEAAICMKSLRNDVMSWPVKPNEEQLQILAEQRANVELAGDRAELITAVARKDNSDMSDEERARLKQVEARVWRSYLRLSEYQREVEKCFSVGDPVPEFEPAELELEDAV